MTVTPQVGIMHTLAVCYKKHPSRQQLEERTGSRGYRLGGRCDEFLMLIGWKYKTQMHACSITSNIGRGEGGGG